MVDEKILDVLPVDFYEYLNQIDFNVNQIRLREGQPVIFEGTGNCHNRQDFIGREITREDINRIIELVCLHSVYAFANEINNGFITMVNGHRVGIAGEIVAERGKVKNIKNISSINIRVAREEKNCGLEFAKEILSNKIPENVLLISPPGKGKTTLLRDIIRILSNKKYNICVVDERMEIAAVSKGHACNDIGLRTDVISGSTKSDGIMMALRSLSPDIIAVDEVAGIKDMTAIREAGKCGVSVFATAHGRNCDEVIKRTGFENVFKKFIVWEHGYTWQCISK